MAARRWSSERKAALACGVVAVVVVLKTPRRRAEAEIEDGCRPDAVIVLPPDGSALMARRLGVVVVAAVGLDEGVRACGVRSGARWLFVAMTSLFLWFWLVVGKS